MKTPPPARNAVVVMPGPSSKLTTLLGNNDVRGMMADLFDFPSVTTEPDPLPYPDESYQAFDSTGGQRFPMLTLILAQDSMVGYRFSDIEKMEFTPAHAPDGLDVLNLRFAWSWATQLETVRIEGRNLLDLTYHVGQQATPWLRMLATGQPVKDPAMPVITRIVIPPED